METVLKSDVFFFITSIAVVIIVIILVPILFQLYKVLRSVRNISENVEEEVIQTRGSLAQIREKIAVIPGLGFLSRGKSTTKKSRKQKKNV